MEKGLILDFRDLQEIWAGRLCHLTVSLEDDSQRDFLKICTEYPDVTSRYVWCKVCPSLEQLLWWTLSHCVIIAWFP